MGQRGPRAILTPGLCFKFYTLAKGDAHAAIEELFRRGVFNPRTREPFSYVAFMNVLRKHPGYQPDPLADEIRARARKLEMA